MKRNRVERELKGSEKSSCRSVEGSNEGSGYDGIAKDKRNQTELKENLKAVKIIPVV